MGRFYSLTFSKVSVSQVQDLISGVTTSSNVLTRIRRFWCMCTDNAVPSGVDQLAFQAWISTATTLGSGGTTANMQRYDINDANGIGTWHANDTTQMTPGTQEILGNWACNVKQGLDVVLSTPAEMAGGDAFAFTLSQAPGAALHLSGGVLIEQIGGT